MRRIIVAVVVLVFAMPLVGAETGSLERYAGIFRLETGEVVHGGLFIERAGGPERFLYFDTKNLEKGGIFRRDGDLHMTSVFPSDAEFTIEFIPGANGRLERIRWQQRGKKPIEGVRIDPFVAHDVEIPANDGVRLHGRLLVPACRGPHPLVVEVGGSGPATRFGGSFDTFWVQLGMAVLTYDKRGVGTPGWTEPDLARLASDAASAYRFGTRRPGIDGKRAGLWGSSQGGWVAPVAAESAAAGFLVVRAGPGVSEGETNLHEVRQELRGNGLHGLDLDDAVALRKELYKLAVEGKPISAADALVAPYLETSWYESAFGSGPISKLWSARWWGWAKRNMSFSSMPALTRYRGPVLWFLGEDDENVPLVPSRAAIERAFAASPGKDHEIDVLKGANHAFLVTTGGETHYVSGYWTRIADWLRHRKLVDAGCWKEDAVVVK